MCFTVCHDIQHAEALASDNCVTHASSKPGFEPEKLPSFANAIS